MKQIMMLLAVMLLTACSKNSEMKAQTMEQKMYITIDGQTQAVTLVDNAATQALVERLKDGAVTVTLNSSGGFEIWGALGFSLPTSNEQINAQLGDVILYNGSNICIFYGTNSWSYTRLGKIDGLLESELRTFLKAGLTPVYADRSTSGRLQGKNTVYFEEAKLVLICKKLYQSELQESGFLYQETIDQNYPQRDFHTMYVGKIEKVLVRDDEYLK